MSSQEQEENRVVLQSKDLNQLLTMANLDVKLNKNAVLKISITDAISIFSLLPVLIVKFL